MRSRNRRRVLAIGAPMLLAIAGCESAALTDVSSRPSDSPDPSILHSQQPSERVIIGHTQAQMEKIFGPPPLWVVNGQVASDGLMRLIAPADIDSISIENSARLRAKYKAMHPRAEVMFLTLTPAATERLNLDPIKKHSPPQH